MSLLQVIKSSRRNVRPSWINSSTSRASSQTAETVTKQEYYKTVSEAQKKEHENSFPEDWSSALPFESIPGPKPLPILGNTFRFLPIVGKYFGIDLLEMSKRLNNEYGDIACIRNMNGRNKNLVFLYTPEYIETLFRNDGIWPSRTGLDGFDYYRRNIREDVFQGVVGTFSSQGEDWFKIRTILNPIMMQTRSVEMYAERMDAIASEFLENMKHFAKSNSIGEMPGDFANELNKYSMEAVGLVALDTRLGCLKRGLKPDSQEQQFINKITEFFELVVKIEIMPSLWPYFSTPTWKRYVEVLDYLTFTIMKYIDQAKIDDLKDKDEKELSMVQRMLKIDKKVAIATAIDMLQAGVDTTSKTVAAILYYLAKNPSVQSKLREECCKLLPTAASPITKDTLKNTKYLKAVIKESQRMSPVASGTIRMLTKNVTIGGYRLPKGAEVLTANQVISRKEKYYPRPDEFIPERWLRTTEDDLSHKNTNPFVFLPFGFGARSCVGKRIAMMEIEVIVLRIVRNFELSWPHEDAVFKTTVVHGIDSPLQFHVKEVTQ